MSGSLPDTLPDTLPKGYVLTRQEREEWESLYARFVFFGNKEEPT